MNLRTRKKLAANNKYPTPLRSILYKTNYFSDKGYENNLLIAARFLATELKMLNISLCSWTFQENPQTDVYIFAWIKKSKEITLYLHPTEVTVFDIDTCTNVKFSNLQEALNSHLQGNPKLWCK